ncbi:M1 family metallopeptidase [Pendulispora albinea]|uniref:Aminopeptidase n=1 Tax=Pendulispora albinea TaxID=2741071 RepID=A0ABZ2M3Y7_9BACT
MPTFHVPTVLLPALACVLAASVAACSPRPGASPPPSETAPVASEPARPEAPPPPELRLPETVRPTAYDVALTVVPTEDRFEGHITIALDVAASSRIVWLHALGLDVRTATIDGAPAKVHSTGSGGRIGLEPARPLSVGRATVVIDYTGAISPKNEFGVFKQKEGEHWYAFTQLEAIDARRAFPCFDEPGFKVPWKLRLKVKKDDRALSNTPPISEKIEGDYKIVQFAETKPLPAYLVAFAVGPMDVVDAGTAGKNHTPVRIVVPRGRGAEARFAKEVTGKILAQLEDYFGIPYPYEKLDCVDIPVFSGAMENPGLVTFGQSLILSVPEKETVRFRHQYIDITAHELGHQWFGDLVTTAWWDDVWLNEAFASWITNRLIETWQPERHKDTERAADTARAMRADSLVSARRIRQPIATEDDIGNAFDHITYEKGAAVIDMFENWVGRDAFRAGVTRYLTKHAHKNATAEQFLAVVFEGERAPVGAAFETFLNQPGVPLVTASLRCDAGQPPKLALAQSRYLPAGAQAPETSWQIPVCARYPGAKGVASSCTLLQKPRGELTLGEARACPAWVSANADGHGYYRVLYQGDLLAKLLAPRSGDAELTRAEKVALLSDLAALVRTSKLSYQDVLAVVPKLAGDPVKDVVEGTIELVADLRSTEMVPEALRPQYARFIRDTYGARAKKLGFVSRRGDSDDTRLLRAKLLLLVADQGEDRALQSEAKALASKWLADRKGVDPDVVETVLAISAQTGDRAWFERMRAALRATTSRFERNQILGALAHFRDPDALRAALAVNLTDDADIRDSLWTIKSAQATPATRAIAYAFMKESFEALAARMPDEAGAFGFGAAAPALAGGGFCDEAHAADLEAFFRERAARYSGGRRSLAQVVESVKGCSAFRALQAPNVGAFFQKR